MKLSALTWALPALFAAWVATSQNGPLSPWLQHTKAYVNDMTNRATEDDLSRVHDGPVSLPKALPTPIGTSDVSSTGVLSTYFLSVSQAAWTAAPKSDGRPSSGKQYSVVFPLAAVASHMPVISPYPGGMRHATVKAHRFLSVSCVTLG